MALKMKTGGGSRNMLVKAASFKDDQEMLLGTNVATGRKVIVKLDPEMANTENRPKLVKGGNRGSFEVDRLIHFDGVQSAGEEFKVGDEVVPVYKARWPMSMHKDSEVFTDRLLVAMVEQGPEVRTWAVAADAATKADVPYTREGLTKYLERAYDHIKDGDDTGVLIAVDDHEGTQVVGWLPAYTLNDEGGSELKSRETFVQDALEKGSLNNPHGRGYLRIADTLGDVDRAVMVTGFKPRISKHAEIERSGASFGPIALTHVPESDENPVEHYRLEMAGIRMFNLHRPRDESATPSSLPDAIDRRCTAIVERQQKQDAGATSEEPSDGEEAAFGGLEDGPGAA